MRTVAALCFGLAYAPLQCASEPDTSLRLEEPPSEALYDLATRFRKEGDQSAWRTTLEQIRSRYPNSRHAVMAADDLAREAELFESSVRPTPAGASAPSDAGG